MHIRPTVLRTLTSSILCLGLTVTCAKKEKDTQSPAVPPSPGALTGIVVDSADGLPVPVRVYITGPDDSVYVAVDGITYDQPRFRERIGCSGRHFTTVGDRFTVRLPA